MTTLRSTPARFLVLQCVDLVVKLSRQVPMGTLGAPMMLVVWMILGPMSSDPATASSLLSCASLVLDGLDGSVDVPGDGGTWEDDSM